MIDPNSYKGLSNQIHHQRTAFHLSLATISLLFQKESHSLLLQQKVYFTKDGDIKNFISVNEDYDYVYDFEKVTEFIEFCKLKADNPMKEFLKVSFRNLITVTYELIFSYCKRTKQIDKFISKPWYQFFRTVRNSLSHDFHFLLPKDRKTGLLIESEWKGRRILSSFEGLPIPIDFLGYNGLLEMFLDLESFIKELD